VPARMAQGRGARHIDIRGWLDRGAVDDVPSSAKLAQAMDEVRRDLAKATKEQSGDLEPSGSRWFIWILQCVVLGRPSAACVGAGLFEIQVAAADGDPHLVAQTVDSPATQPPRSFLRA
jgi:hypothetical protein